MAGPFTQDRDAGRRAGPEYMHPGQKSLLGADNRRPRVGDEQAAAQVRRAFSNYKILSLRLLSNGKGPPFYRAKMLSPNGVVKYVYVDAISGQVFE